MIVKKIKNLQINEQIKPKNIEIIKKSNTESACDKLVELANYVSDEYVDESFDVDGFLAEDGYYGGFYMVPFEGKITLKVYNGFAKITELYLGDELILKLK